MLAAAVIATVLPRSLELTLLKAAPVMTLAAPEMLVLVAVARVP